MIIPSIDIMGGHAVQLVGGREKVLDAGDPRPLARKFGLVGQVAVIDLDAALGTGSNASIIEELCKIAPCRVGGGIRDVDTAMRWLDRGAAQVLIGTAAREEVLSQLPRERVIVALDALEGDVVVEGWRKGTGVGIAQRMRELEGLAGGFLVTFVEMEGRLGGTHMDKARELATLAASVGATLTVAGGITCSADIATLDRLGVDAQVGMALYTGQISLAEAFAAPLNSDRADGLWPTVICDEGGVALGLAWSSLESLTEAIDGGCGVYQSRKRGLWKKGETSGATQELIGVAADCDRDTLRFLVRQAGPGFCHRDTAGCWGESKGVRALMKTLGKRRGVASVAQERGSSVGSNASASARVGAGMEAGAGGGVSAEPVSAQPKSSSSYTARLLADPSLLAAKLTEEAGELAEAVGKEAVAWEAADVVYFTAVAMERCAVTWADVERELDRRARKVIRRRGDAKVKAALDENDKGLAMGEGSLEGLGTANGKVGEGNESW